MFSRDTVVRVGANMRAARLLGFAATAEREGEMVGSAPRREGMYVVGRMEEVREAPELTVRVGFESAQLVVREKA